MDDKFRRRTDFAKPLLTVALVEIAVSAEVSYKFYIPRI